MVMELISGELPFWDPLCGLKSRISHLLCFCLGCFAIGIVADAPYLLLVVVVVVAAVAAVAAAGVLLLLLLLLLVLLLLLLLFLLLPVCIYYLQWTRKCKFK